MGSSSSKTETTDRSTDIVFSKSGLGATWPDGSKITDDGGLRLNSATDMYFTAPSAVNISSPSAKFSGTVDATAFTVNGASIVPTIPGSSNWLSFNDDGTTGVGWGAGNASSISDTNGSMRVTAPSSLNFASPSAKFSGTVDATGFTVNGASIVPTVPTIPGSSNWLVFNNDATGVAWNAGKDGGSRIFDDGDLRFTTDDAMHFNAPTLFEVTSPKSTFSGTVDAQALTVKGTPVSSSSPPVWTGPYYVVLTTDGTKALDASTLATGHMLNTLNRSTATQQWMREPTTGMLKNVGNGRCLTVSNKNSNALSFVNCNGSNAGQQWVRGPGGTVASVLQLSDGSPRCLDVNARTPNAPAYTWNCQNNNNNQMFGFVY